MIGKLPSVADVIATLASFRKPANQQQPPGGGGVYAIYLRSGGSIRRYAAGLDGLVYIGKSSNLAERDFETHFESGRSGYSTLRRSIGAILKKKLALVATPRSVGPSKTNTANYKFEPDGEERLTKWMIENLDIACYPFDGEYSELEDALIAEMRPVLNLKGWENPDRKEIKNLRAYCADEAQSRR